MKITKKLVSFGVSGVLPGAPNTGKRKMTHYYCTRCDLATFSDPQKGTPKPLKVANFLIKITPKSSKFGEIAPKNHHICGENH